MAAKWAGCFRRGLGQRLAITFVGAFVGAVLLVAATLAAAVLGSGTPAAGAPSTAGVSFIDDRPAFVDLDGSDRRWEVDVINTDTTPTAVSLQVVDAGGLLSIEAPRIQTIPAGATGAFDLDESPENVTVSSPPSTGELLLTASDGSLQRRGLTLVHGEQSVPPPAELTLSGWLLAPLLGRVELPTVAASKYLDGQPPATLGVVDSTVGRQGFVVDDGADIRVVGIRDSGSYSGTAVLAPATTTKINVDVRDTPLWPVMALIVGLAVVSRIDDYSKRTAPRRQLQIRLLRRKAEIEKSQQESASKVVGALGPESEPTMAALVSVPGDSRTLVYERIAEEVLQAFDMGDQDVRNEWLSTGKAWEATDAGLGRCCGFLDAVGELADHFVALQQRAGGAEVVTLTRSLLTVREAMQPGAITSLDALAAAATNVSGAQATIRSFEQALTLLAMAAQRGGDEQALRALRVRLLAGDDITEVCDEAGKIMNAAAQKAPPAPAAAGPLVDSTAHYAPGGPPGRVDVPPSPAGAARPGPGRQRGGARSAMRLAAVGAGVVVITVVLMSLALSGGAVRTAHPGGQTTTTVGGLAFTGPPLPLPVEAPVVSQASSSGSKSASVASWVLEAGVMPVVIGLPLALGLWFGLTKWLGRRSARTLGRLEEEDRQAQRRFLLVSSVIVLASGLAVLYVPNSHWGSLGDFVTAVLWGTGTTAGLSIARRFLPSP